MRIQMRGRSFHSVNRRRKAEQEAAICRAAGGKALFFKEEFMLLIKIFFRKEKGYRFASVEIIY